MGYVWPGWALDALRGLEPYEVLQVLGAVRRWPRWATGPGGVHVLTVWGRTEAGRPLVVAVQQVDAWEWQILGARDVRLDELAKFEAWEVENDG